MDKPAGIDPRLTHVPEDLRSVAVEFLDLHQAWGTKFKSEFGTYIDGMRYVKLVWGGGWGKAPAPTAEFTWFDTEQSWDAHADCEAYDFRMTGDPAKGLRRSADFAEFLKHFQRGRDGV